MLNVQYSAERSTTYKGLPFVCSSDIKGLGATLLLRDEFSARTGLEAAFRETFAVRGIRPARSRVFYAAREEAKKEGANLVHVRGWQSNGRELTLHVSLFQATPVVEYSHSFGMIEVGVQAFNNGLLLIHSISPWETYPCVEVQRVSGTKVKDIKTKLLSSGFEGLDKRCHASDSDLVVRPLEVITLRYDGKTKTVSFENREVPAGKEGVTAQLSVLLSLAGISENLVSLPDPYLLDLGNFS